MRQSIPFCTGCRCMASRSPLAWHRWQRYTLLPDSYPLDGAIGLEISSFEDEGLPLTPPQALARLADRPAVPEINTRLSEDPFWFSFVVPASDQAAVVELPSRHALDVACWSAAGLQPLGSATRTAAGGAMKASKTGFALELGPLPAPTQVLCQASHTGPAHISVILWLPEQFRVSRMKFHRNSGLLDGGLIMLSLFVLMTADRSTASGCTCCSPHGCSPTCAWRRFLPAGTRSGWNARYHRTG